MLLTLKKHELKSDRIVNNELKKILFLSQKVYTKRMNIKEPDSGLLGHDY